MLGYKDREYSESVHKKRSSLVPKPNMDLFNLGPMYQVDEKPMETMHHEDSLRMWDLLSIAHYYAIRHCGETSFLGTDSDLFIHFLLLYLILFYCYIHFQIYIHICKDRFIHSFVRALRSKYPIEHNHNNDIFRNCSKSRKFLNLIP